MKTVRCPQCNLVNWLTAANCKRCQSVLQSAEMSAVETALVGGFQPSPNQTAVGGFQPSPYQPKVRTLADLSGAAGSSSYQEPTYQPRQTHSNYQQPNNYQAQNNYYQPNYQTMNLKSGLAIASMIFGILAFVTAIFMVGILFAPIGIILAIVALVKATKKPNEYGGKGFAIAGLVTSGMVLLIVPIILAIAIPNLMAAGRAANEGSAISTVRSISSAVGGGKINGSMPTACWNMDTLVRNKSVNEGLADGEHNGYRFTIVDFPSGGCEVNAVPLSTSHGTRSFYYSTEEGRIHGANKNGATAGKNDPVID